MRVSALALLGLSTAANAQPAKLDPFCDELVQVIRAAGETPPFASFPMLTGRRGPPMLGFPSGCGRQPEARQGPAFICYRQLPPPELRVDALADRIARCLPAAERLPDGGEGGPFGSHIVRFRTRGATIAMAEGGWRTEVGGQVELTIRPAR